MNTTHFPLAVLLALAACKASPTAPAPVATASSAAVASPRPAATAAPAPSASAKRGDRRKAEAVDAAQQASFARAVAGGRKATAAKRYDDAISAFGDALRAMPDSAAALAERGYAELLGDRLDDAEKDLAKARGLTRDPALLGPIAFNLGLVREKRKDTEGARAAFAQSNDIRPTRAAEAKLAALGGSASCTATDLSAKLPYSLFSIAEDWVTAHATVRYGENDPWPDDEAAAKRATCVRSSGNAAGPPQPSDVCDGPPPWIITTTYQSFRTHMFAVVPLHGHRLLVGDLEMMGGGPCSVGGDSSIYDGDTKLLGRVLLVDHRVTSYLWRPVGQKNDTDPVPPDAEFECREGGKDRTLTLVDLDRERVLFLSSVDPESEPSVVHDPANGQVVKLRGGGCDATYVFGK
jgi:hypothetical protein